MEYEELKSYLKDVYEVEKQLFVLREIEKLYKEECDRWEKESTVVYYYDSILGDVGISSDRINKIGLVKPSDAENMSKDDYHRKMGASPESHFPPRWPNLDEEIGRIKKRFYRRFGRKIKDRDLKPGSGYRQALLEIYTPNYNRDFEKKRKICLSYYEKRNKEYNDVILTAISTSERALSCLYAKDIIHAKYRNIVAIAQIYEYIDTGRCTELIGPNGAYNLFEQELRQNIIIDRLDQIINQLARLNATMSYVASAIDTTNRILGDISSSLSSLEANTALIAYNSQCIANNTRIANTYAV